MILNQGDQNSYQYHRLAKIIHFPFSLTIALLAFPIPIL